MEWDDEDVEFGRLMEDEFRQIRRVTFIGSIIVLAFWLVIIVGGILAIVKYLL